MTPLTHGRHEDAQGLDGAGHPTRSTSAAHSMRHSHLW